MMNNAYATYDTHGIYNGSYVLWSSTLLNARDNEDVFSACSPSLQSTRKPRFSLAHTSLFTSTEALPAFLALVETRFDTNYRETDNDDLAYFINEDRESDIALFTQCLS